VTTSHVLSLLKNLVPATDVPSTAERSTVPVFTFPVALVFTMLLETYVPLAFVKSSTALDAPTSTQPGVFAPGTGGF